MVRQTSCRHCGQDIENFSPYKRGGWRDRGNNLHCPTPEGDAQVHQPNPEDVQEAPVKVLFRVAEGEVFAVFPELKAGPGQVTTYQHIGQHSGGHYRICIDRSRPATPKEYQPLYRELTSAPYHYRLAIRERYTRQRRQRD